MPALVNVLSLLVAFMQLAGARRYPQDLTHTPDVTLQLYKSQVQVVWMSTYSSISSNTSSMVFASSSHPSPGLAPRFTGLRTLRLLIPPTCYHLHTELDLTADTCRNSDFCRVWNFTVTYTVCLISD